MYGYVILGSGWRRARGGGVLVRSCAGKTRRRWRSPWLLRPWGGGGAEEERWVKAEEEQ